MPINPMVLMAGAQLAGGIADKIFGSKEAKKERARQEQFAKSGIQWRVEDAKKAGIHPLAALGFQGVSPTPVTVGTDFASVGQNISRSIDATRTNRDRSAAISKTMEDLTIRKMGLENDLLAAQIAQINQAGHPPGFPGGKLDIAGQPYTDSLAMGGRFITNRNVSDAQTFEDRWGGSELAEMLFGAGVLGADVLGAVKRVGQRKVASDARARAALKGYIKRAWDYKVKPFRERR